MVRVRAEPLQVVVEVRQVAERERRLARGAHVHRGARDPLAGGDVGGRPPELEQREWSEPGVELVVQIGRLGIVIRDLAAVRRIHRPRRRAPVGRGVHVVPPEHLGAGEVRVAPLAGLPDLLAGDQAVRLAPQPYFGEIAEIPAVRHRAMPARRQPGHERGLHRAGDRGRDRIQRPQRAALGQAPQVGRVRADQRRRQAHHQDDQGRLHAPTSVREPGDGSEHQRRFRPRHDGTLLDRRTR